MASKNAREATRQILKWYERGIRADFDKNTIDYIICFDDEELNIPAIAQYDYDGGDFCIYELKVPKRKSNISSIETGGAGINGTCYRRISPLFTFQRKKDESNAEYLLRILKHARRFKLQRGSDGAKIKPKIVELLDSNLRGLMRVLYHA